MPSLLNNNAEEEYKRFHEEVEELKDVWESYHQLLTSYREREEEIRKKNQELKEINESKDKFFSIIAHDLRSPFQGLLGFSKILAEEYDSLTQDEIKYFINSLNEALINQYKFLEDLLNWSRIQSNRMVCEPKLLNLSTQLEDVLMLLYQNIKNKKITLHNKVDKELIIYADENMLALLLRNIISNAIKFTHNNGLIEIYALKRPNDVIIDIRDNGVGIAEENIEKLFRIDTQYTTAGTNQEKGNGLGLVLCKEIVDKHKGKIWVESSLGKGTSFKILFPHKD